MIPSLSLSPSLFLSITLFSSLPFHLLTHSLFSLTGRVLGRRVYCTKKVQNLPIGRQDTSFYGKPAWFTLKANHCQRCVSAWYMYIHMYDSSRMIVQAQPNTCTCRWRPSRSYFTVLIVAKMYMYLEHYVYTHCKLRL